MRRAERVVDVDVRVGGERLRERRVVLLLLHVEAEVLEQQHLAGAEPLDGVLGAGAERVAGDRDGLAQQLAEALADRAEPEAVADLAVGAAEVAGEDHAGALRLEVADRRERRADARVVGDPAVLERDVEVDADEDALARGVQVPDGELVHGSVPPGAGRRGPSVRPIGGRGQAGARRRTREVRHAAAVAPLVVVPGDDLDEVAAQDHVRREVDDGRAGVAPEVGRDERLVARAEDALHRAGRGVAEGLVELLER